MTQESLKSRCLSELCRADAEVLDRIIENEWRLSGGESRDGLLKFEASYAAFSSEEESSERREKMGALLSVIGCGEVAEPAGDLVGRTLAAIQEVKQKQRFAEQIQALGGPDLGLRWREFVAVAAAIVIGVSVGWPMLARSSEHARRVACSNNLATTGAAIGGYAQDANNMLPRGRVQPGGVWYRVGQTPGEDGTIKSNSANLYLLVRNGYVAAEDLACPENPFAPRHMDRMAHDWPTPEAVSYSYQNQFAAHKVSLDAVPQLPILADKNPLFDISVDSLTLRGDPQSSSRFHQNLGGQNVLTADGNVMWASGPVMRNGDNIWLIRGVDQYKGKEAPVEMGDAFLVP